MLRELIIWVLNTYLGKYLEDFNPAQLSVALLSGEVELENIPIRKDALRSFGIPVQVISGIIGKIKLQIPIRQFRSAPWCIVVEHVYAVFSPKSPSCWDDENERTSEYDFKISELNSKEAIWRAQKGYYTESQYYAASYSNWLNYGTALATNVMENLELKINDVHIRYEDTLTIPGTKFSFGFHIDSLTIQSCDSSWILRSKSSFEKDIAFKLIELSNFAIYWDTLTDNNTCSNMQSKELLQNMDRVCNTSFHNYIINPISARAECKRERCKLPLRTRSRPRLSCNVQVSEVNITLTDIQYEQIISCFSGLQNLSQIRSFKIYRPRCRITGNVRCWWRYAAQCCGFIFETKTEKYKKLSENLRYMKIYRSHLLSPNEYVSKEDKDFKSNMERVRSLEELSLLRRVCFNSLKTNDVKYQSSNITKGKSMLFHWFPNWWGWYGSTATDACYSQPNAVEDETYQNIEDEILSALEDSVGSNSYVKRDSVFGNFNFKLAAGKFSICSQDYENMVLNMMMEINFQTLNLMIETRPRSGSYLIGLSLGSVCLIDHLTPETKFPDLIRPQNKESTILSNSAVLNINFKQKIIPSINKKKEIEDQGPEPWFQLQYEKRPICCNSDYRLLIKSRSLDIVNNTQAFQWLIGFFTSPLNIIKGMKRFTDRRKVINQILFRNWKNLIEDNLELRSSWSFEIDIAAPQIIFVDNFSDNNSAIVLIDFGRFQLLKHGTENKIKEHTTNTKAEIDEIACNETEMETDDEDTFVTPCSTPPGSKNSHSDSPTLCFSSVEASKIIINTDTGLECAFHNKIYDKYIINLTDLQVLICKNMERNFASIKGTSLFHLLEKFSISLELERRVIHTLDPEFPSFTLFGTLPKLVVHVNDQKINAIMEMLSLISLTNTNDMMNQQNENLNNLFKKTQYFKDTEKSNNVFNSSNRFIVNFVIDQMTLEVQSQDRSIAELQIIGARAGLSKKTEETNISLSVHGLLLVDAIQSLGQDFELLVASHRQVGMDSISGSLKQSEPCSPTSPASPDPTTFKRPTSPHVISKALDSLQTSNFNSWLNPEDTDALIIVDLNYIKEGTGITQVANIHFNTLDIIANQETIAELIMFIKRIAFSFKSMSESSDELNKSSKNEKVFREEINSQGFFQHQTEISFDFHRLNILVLRALKKDNFIVGRKVGTFTMSEAKIHASLGNEICVTGSLGGLQILDVTPEGINHQRIFSVGKDPLSEPSELIRRDMPSSLAQEVYGLTSKDNPNEQKDALMFTIIRNKNCILYIKLRMASVWYTHCARFIKEINWCAFQFKHYIKNFARSIRNKATDMAIELVQQIHDQTKIEERFCKNKPKVKKEKVGNKSQIMLDVILNSPVIVLPRSSRSTEVLVANLGKISLCNAENGQEVELRGSDSTVNLSNELNIQLLYGYYIEFKKINIFSLDTLHRKELRLSALPRAEEFYSCENGAIPILHDTALKLELSNYFEKTTNDNENRSAEFISVKGSVTQLLKVSLSRNQYEQLLESLDNAFKVPTEIAAPCISTSYSFGDAISEANYGNNRHDISKHYDNSYNMGYKIYFSLPILVIALNNEHHNPLIELTFKEFSTYYNQQSNMHTILEIFLRSILMEDLKCGKDSKYRHMVDSAPAKTLSKKKNNVRISSSCPNLVNLHNLNNTSRSIPDNLQFTDEEAYNQKMLNNNSNRSSYRISSYCCGNQSESSNDDNLVTYIAQFSNSGTTDSKCFSKIMSSIEFNSLNLVISVERWFMLLDFFGLLSESEVSSKLDRDNSKHLKSDHISNENSDVSISVRSLNLIFVKMDSELAKANVSNASFKIKKHSGNKIIDGRFGSISLIDLTSFGKNFKEKFQTSGPEALNFHYERSHAAQTTKKTLSLEKDAVLKIKMSSVRYIHTKRFVLEIQTFIKELLQLQTPVIKKIKLSDSNSDIKDYPTKIEFQIHAASPIILLPLSHESNDLLVADLGEFTLKNNFCLASDSMDEIIDVMQVDLVKINLFAGKRIVQEMKINEKECFNLGSFYVVKCGKNIFEDKCYLKLQIERNMSLTTRHNNFPDVRVKGTLSKVSCILNLQQYKLVRGFLAYNLGENTESINENNLFDICESVSKINSADQTYDNRNETSVWNVLSIKIDLEDVSVHLHQQIPNSMESTTLACINFIKSFLEIDSFSDGSQDIDLVSSEILISDSRNNQHSFSDKAPSNIFTDILKPIRKNALTNVVQAEVHSRKRIDCNKYTILLNNMRIMAIIDWMESVKEYINEHVEFPLYETQKLYSRSLKSAPTYELPPFEVILNITDSELVFVENTNQFDTSAIILKSTTVLSYKPNDFLHPISININHLEVFSCIFGFENDSALSIIDPITLNIELQKNQLDFQIQKQLCIRLSYHDFKLFSKMLQSISVQTCAVQSKKTNKNHTNIDFEVIAPLIAMGFNPKDCLYAMEVSGNKLNDAAMWLSQKKQCEAETQSVEIKSMSFIAQCISVCVIDDCKDADVPLLEISLSHMSLYQTFNSDIEISATNGFHYISGNLTAIISGDYFNRRLSGWEPVIEPWECTALWKYNSDIYSSFKSNYLDFQIHSKQLLKLNLTSTIIELCKLVRTNWTQDYYEGISRNNANVYFNLLPNYRLRTPFVPFALENQTGEILHFKIILSQPGKLTRIEIVQRDLVNDWIEVKPNEIVPFTYGPQNKLRHLDSHRLSVHQILVAVNGWTMVGPLSIDKVGVFFRYSTEETLGLRNRIVFDISLIGSSQKLIIVRSAVKVFNTLNKSVSVNIGFEEENHTYNIKPNECFSVPLNKIGSLIYIKPCDVITDQGSPDNKLHSKFEFCKRGISWSDSAIDLVENLCVCPCKNGPPFNILAIIKRDRYPNRDVLHMPGHTILLVTPLIITNMLCCDILYKISDHIVGRIHASESATIYDVNIFLAFIISFTLDNYNVSGQLRIPTNHSGIVEPKLMLLDINSRELYLRASIQLLKGKGMEIFISAPVWLVNKTGLPLIYRQEGVFQLAAGQFEEHEKARNITPLMFSFSDPDASPLLEVRLGKRFGENNPWCKSFSVQKDIIYRQLQEEDGKGNFAIGIEVRRGRGRYSCTNVVTISPRFQLYNRSSYKLQFAQKCDILISELPTCERQFLTAISGCHFPFHWPNCDQEPLLCVRLLDMESCQWSSGIPINDVQSVYINIRNDVGEMFFLRLEVILHGATYFLLFGDAYSLPPPIRVDNYSEVQVNFFQKGYKPQWTTVVRPHLSLAYVLDDPTGIQTLQLEAPGGNTIDFPLNKLELSRSLTYSNFIYIAFRETFLPSQSYAKTTNNNEIDIENQQLVLGVRDKRVILMKKCAGDRSQLWLMNSSGHLEHEGSSPPVEPGKYISASESRMVLDLEKPPNPMAYTNLVIRPPNKQRETTQTWRFQDGRLMCHANMCVQAKDGVFGLIHGGEVVLGRMESESRSLSKSCIPIEQCIERQKLRPGSGHLEIISKMDGPILAIQIRDVKVKPEEEVLHPDPLWEHTSTIVKKNFKNGAIHPKDDCLVKFDLNKGVGISLISRHPCEELLYITLQNFIFECFITNLSKSIDFKISDIQIDNQLLDTSCPVLLHTTKSTNEDCETYALVLNTKVLQSLNKNAVIIEYVTLCLKPYTVILDERLILKVILFLGHGLDNELPKNIETENETLYFEGNILSRNSKRYYFDNLYIGPFQIRLSVCTASKLSPQLMEIKKSIGLTLIKFEDAILEFDKFSERHHFETIDVYLTVVKMHYINQIKWHAASIIGSVDFLGNPLGFANDLSEGVSGLIFEGSVKSLVRNVTHGISNSTAKLTETLSDSIGRVVLDDTDNEARQKILEISSGSNTSAEHLAAGLKGLGFGLLGGITSIVRHTYAGAQTDGLHGFISGFGKGIVGTVTKPLIGVLDLASETASAVRETSRGNHRALPERKRWPRCLSGAPGGLLPTYSYRQSKGQQYLYMINRRNFSEYLISYEPNLCNDRDAKLRLLVSTEYVRIFSRCEEDPSIVLDCHLSEVLSCHPVIASIGSFDLSIKSKPMHYIEISTNLPKITRPRIRCQNEEVAERASRYINYAKSVYDEREQTVAIE